MNNKNLKIHLHYFIITFLSLFFLKFVTELVKYVSNYEFFLNVITNIGSLNGIYSISAIDWYPQVDNFVNLLIICVFLICFFQLSKIDQTKPINKVLLFFTLFLGCIVFASNILINEYRGWDLFLYCELSPVYNDINPYLKEINGLTSVYSPVVWSVLFKICNLNIFYNLILKNFIWIFTGIGIFFITLIRGAEPTFRNSVLNLTIILSFIGTNYHGLKTGNIGYVVGITIAYLYIRCLKYPNKISYALLLGIALLIKPFYLFWFAVSYVFGKAMRKDFVIVPNLKVILIVQIIGNLINFLFYKKEYVFFLENLLQLNNSINKPLADKSGFLNLIFQDYIFRIFSKTFQLEINSIMLLLITILLVILLKKYFIKPFQFIVLPALITPRFKTYDLTFLLLIFSSRNIRVEFILFCTVHISVFIIFSFLGAGYLIEISYILTFVLYIQNINSQSNKLN